MTYPKFNNGQLLSILIQIFTGTAPFSDKPPRAAVSTIKDGGRPPRPTHPDFADYLWGLIQECWNQEASRRPNALEILCCL